MPGRRPFEAIDCCSSEPALDWAYQASKRLLANPVDEAISMLFADIGKAADVDRVFMLEYDLHHLRFRNAYEWCRCGVRSFLKELQDTPVTLIAWLHQSLVKGEALMIHDVDNLPRVARSLQIEMLRQNDKSVLCVPVMHDGSLRACLGFDMTRHKRRWRLEEANELSRCAALIATARYGCPAPVGQPLADAAATPAPLIFLLRQSGARGVGLDEILGLRSAQNYTEVWLGDGSVVLDQRPLKIWAGLVPKAGFMRIHRTAIVNLQHVVELDRPPSGVRWDVRLRTLSKPWSVSRAYQQELRQRLGI